MADQGQQRYRVIKRLASGGMAEVFLAESAGLKGFKKQVAIKRVLPHLSEKKRFIAMFLDEARLSAHLSHSNVVQVFDIGVGDSSYFIVMEYVEGADLKRCIKHLQTHQQPFPIEAAIYISSKICEGLAYAHEMKDPDGQPLHAVHRDVSPPNVLISKHGEIKIVDFGLAKASTQLEKSEAGIIKGKFSYLSPEAARGEEVDVRADIFAVGIMLWEMLAGRRLFQGTSDYETVKLVQAAEVPPIAKFNSQAIDPQLESILRRALARDRSARYASARALGVDLTQLLYRLGKPVDAFNISELVRGAMAEQPSAPTDGVSIIDKLIAETLLEFTSLRDKEGSNDDAEQTAAQEKDGAFDGLDDFSDWEHVQDSEADGVAEVRDRLSAHMFEDGNLAMLEGAEPLPSNTGQFSTLEEGPPSSRRPGSEASPPSSSAARRPPVAQFTTVDSSASPGKVTLVLLLLAAAAGAAAHFGGFI